MPFLDDLCSPNSSLDGNFDNRNEPSCAGVVLGQQEAL